MNKTIRNSIEIAASIKDINEMLPGLKESEIIGYAYNIMARDIANGDLRSTTIWDDLLKLDFGDKKKKLNLLRQEDVLLMMTTLQSLLIKMRRIRQRI